MNADERRSSERAAGWCRPVAPRHPPFAFFAVPIPAARYRSTEGQNGASRGAPAPAEGTTRGRTSTGHGRRVFCEIAQRPSQRKDGHSLGGRGFCEIAQQPSGRGRLLSPGSTRAGARPGEGQAQVAADVVFAKSRNDPPAGAGSSRRVRPGRGHDPGKDGHRSRRTWFLRNCATTLPPGQAPVAGLTPAGCAAEVTAPGERRAQVVGDVFFAKSRNDPPAGAGSRRRTRFGRVRRSGHRPGERRAQVAVCSVFAKLRNDPPAGAGSCRRTRFGRVRRRSHRPGGTTGAGRGGRGFLRNRATTLPPGQAPAAGLASAGCTAQLTASENDGRRSRWARFLRNCATTLPPGQAPAAKLAPAGCAAEVTAGGTTGAGRGGRVCEIAHDPPAGAGSRRRSLRPGARRGHRPGTTGGGRGDVIIAKLCNDPPAGLGPDGSATGGTTGAGRGGRGFLRNRATTLPPGQAPPAEAGARRRTRSGQQQRSMWFRDLARRRSPRLADHTCKASYPLETAGPRRHTTI